MYSDLTRVYFKQVCAWVHQHGGWNVVLRSGLNIAQQAAIIGMCAAVITCCFIYIRKNCWKLDGNIFAFPSIIRLWCIYWIYVQYLPYSFEMIVPFCHEVMESLVSSGYKEICTYLSSLLLLSFCLSYWILWCILSWSGLSFFLEIIFLWR